MKNLYEKLGEINRMSNEFSRGFKEVLNADIDNIELEDYRTLIYEIKQDMNELLETINSKEE